jgi:hypothetical protein
MERMEKAKQPEVVGITTTVTSTASASRKINILFLRAFMKQPLPIVDQAD